MVSGSRSWSDRDAIRAALEGWPATTTLLHGNANGADRIAASVAAELGYGLRPYEPDWERHGKRAGILDERPDVVLAFWDGRSHGTRHTIREARRRGIPVQVFRPHGPLDEREALSGLAAA